MAPKTPSVDITVVTKNLRALHGALEHSLTIQRNRLQEIVDDLVSRGTLTRSDADGLLNQLVTSSKDYSQALLKVLDSVAADARRGLGGGIAPVMATAGKTAGMIADTVRKAPGLAAKKPRTAPKAAAKPAAKPPTTAASEPIPGYADLTVAEIKPRLTGLSAGALRRVRDLELAGKARKSVLGQIDQLLGPKSGS
jgi:hypothetical protein